SSFISSFCAYPTLPIVRCCRKDWVSRVTVERGNLRGVQFCLLQNLRRGGQSQKELPQGGNSGHWTVVFTQFSLPRLFDLVLEDPAVFHHEYHIPQHLDVAQRISIHRDEVGIGARRDH